MTDNYIAKTRYGRTVGIASGEARRSGLPGLHNGPADAYRHVIGAAELTRRFGPTRAKLVLDLHEARNEFRGQPDKERVMDERANEIGVRIGTTAKTYEEIVDAARQEIDKAQQRNGSGGDGTVIWQPPSDWSKGPDGGGTNWPPDWQRVGPPVGHDQGGEKHRYEGFRDRRGDVLDLPIEEWSEEDVGVVHRLAGYWDRDHPDHDRIQRKARAWYERRYNGGGGSVAVKAHARDGGTVNVSSHFRRAPGG